MKNIFYISVFISCSWVAQSRASELETRIRILNAARSLIGTTEDTRHNDGEKIDEILATVNLENTGSPYCAAFNRWCYDHADLSFIGPRSAWAPDWVRLPTWKKGHGVTPLPGDTFGIYFTQKNRVAHTGIVERFGKSVITTIEANTSPDATFASEADRNEVQMSARTNTPILTDNHCPVEYLIAQQIR